MKFFALSPRGQFCAPAFVVVVCLQGACLVGELPGVPCGADDQCPSEHFCDIPNDRCLALVNGIGAADLVVTGVRDPLGAVVAAPRVPQDVDSTLQLIIANQGGTSADDIELEMIPLVCLNLKLDPQTLPTTLEPGAETKIEFTVHPEGCSTPSIQDWFLFYSGRAKRGTFNILPDRP